MKPLFRFSAGVLLLAAVASPAAAQDGPRFELGGFGTFTRYDEALLLDDRIGGGARLAFHVNRFLGLELEGVYTGPSAVAGNASYGIHLGSASLLLGGGGRRFSLYVLGGFSRLDIGTTFPYDYAENGFHGGAGFRIGITDRLALRFDGRGVFMPDDNLVGSTTHMIGSVGLSYFTKPWPGAPRREPEEPARPPIVADEEQPGAPAPVAAPREAAPTRMRAQVVGRPSAEQIEISLYGSFTRYDRSFALDNQSGAGVRLGYFLSDRFNIEVEGAYQGPRSKVGAGDAQVGFWSASLGYNFPAGGHSVYLLGGVTRAQWGDPPPYEFSDNGVHGALGARYFLTSGMALRVEGRAIYAPETNSGTAPWSGHVVGSAGLSFIASPPRQVGTPGLGGRSYQWYWGGQGGMFLYQTNLQPLFYEPLIGGHWMITAKRTSLYVGYEQAFFLTEARAAIFDPSAETTGQVREVAFGDMRRIMFGLLAHPAQKVIEPFGGLGFAMMQVLDPQPDCTSDCETISKAAEAFERAEEAASKAFFWLMGGIQMNYSNRLNVFGHYILTSSARDFLLQGNTHTIQGGIRYSFGSAKEGFTERN